MSSIFKRPGRDKWYATINVPGSGRTVRCTGTTCKRTAEQIVAAWETSAAQREALGIDTAAENLAEQRDRPLRTHLAEFVQYLSAKGTSDVTIDAAEHRIGRIFDEAKATMCSDLTPAAVLNALQALRVPGKVVAQGLSNKTALHYLRAIKGFSKWLVRDHRATVDPLAGASLTINADTGRRRVRRDLSVDEVERLIRAAESSPTVSVPRRYRDDAKVLRESSVTITAPYRAWLYRVAAATGLRAGELGSLTPQSFDLRSDTPVVTVEAAYSKRRRRDVQPLPVGLVNGLAKFLTGKPIDSPVFPIPDKKAALLLRADLETARAAWVREATNADDAAERAASDFLRYCDAAGRVADFHSLRVTFISRVAETGATLKQAMELARHSDPKLTMRTYARVGLATLGGIVDGLAVPGAGSSERVRAQALRTGTDDVPVGPKSGMRCGMRKGHETVRMGATGRDHDTTVPGEGPAHISLDFKEKRVAEASEGLPASNAEGRTRTADLRVMNPANHPCFTEANDVGMRSGMRSGVEPPQSAPIDPDLAELAAAWSNLSPVLRAGILAMVRAGASSGR